MLTDGRARVGGAVSGLLPGTLTGAIAVSWLWRHEIVIKCGLLTSYAAILLAASGTSAALGKWMWLGDTVTASWIKTTIAIYCGLQVAALLWRVFLAASYRPWPAAVDSDLPTVTVVLPAYNEGPAVGESMHSILASDYPRQKLELVCVDDGSVDDTWAHMTAAAAGYDQARVRLVRLPHNQGKRRASLAGIRMSRAAVIVTIDSDSTIDPDTLRHLISPLVAEAEIATVAGNVTVKNVQAGLIPRMLRASFVQAFDFARCAQSQFGAVFCTPGALRAHRRSCLDQILPEWSRQHFLGRPATIGEDRALTTLHLRGGYRSVFQANAMVRTDVPVHWRQLVRMFLRWERSNVRENLAMARFFYKPWRRRHWLFANLEYLMHLCAMLVTPLFMAAMLIAVLLHPSWLAMMLAWVIVLSLLMQAYYWRRHRDSGWIYGVLYGLVWSLALWWLPSWGVLTARNGSWMTRDKPPHSPEPGGARG